jgi:uncharacterized protein
MYIGSIKLNEIMNKVNLEMNKIYGNKLNKVILYGSYARQQESEESDIDIMVLVDDDSCALKNYDELVLDFEVDMNLEYDIVLSIYTKSLMEYLSYIEVLPFLKNVNREGKVYYG